MAYRWVGENWGLSLIKDAIAAGYTVAVTYDGEVDYKGTQPMKAWEAVTALDECLVRISKDGARTEYAYLVLDYGQEGDEVINDHSTGGWIEQWWDDKFNSSNA